MMQTATFAKRRHNAESIRGIHPEAIPIDNMEFIIRFCIYDQFRHE